MRLPLIDGQGNFGSMDGDPPAAMRYTEARLAQAADALLADIDKDTVDFRPNYDESDREPTVLPAQFPNLLVNGAGGIAVGMATNIPPHNLGEVIDACLALIDDPELGFERLLELIPGPDFPTGGIILGQSGHPPGVRHRARQPAAAQPHPRRGGPQGPRRDHRHRDPLSGQQEPDAGAHRRAGARAPARGHRRPARRVRSRRHARRDRAEARGRSRHRAQPAVPPHALADQLRRQPGGARPAAGRRSSTCWRCCAPSSSSARR